jgi:hypothetical protein
MSDVAGLFNVPSTQSELNTWTFAHAAHHVDINRVIFQRTGVALASYVLDPLDPNNAEVWLYQHQLLHQAQDAILGIEGYDLLDVDLKDQDQLAGWIWVNADEHYKAAQILEIG